ncbi:MAG TPA: tetratricopeptide repeat protein, partial [Gemmatimonadaceae bacterium]|nr:tetratricopeptide repeat protein [Gemmatimonadaceae bacterium]
ENPRRYFAPFANELRKAGDTAQAISVCRAHLAGQPGHVSGHIVLGQALYEAGEALEARDIFTAALELDPENLIALRTLGEIAQVNGEFGAARQWYERLLDADPRNNEVAQVLKDLPAPATPEAAAPLDADEAEDADRLPYNARAEAETAPPPHVPAAPAPSFHTSFTGSSPAVSSKPDETAREESTADTASRGPVDSAAPEPEVEPVAASAPESAEAIEMVDFDSFSTHAPDAVAYASAPDESFDAPHDEVLEDDYIVDFDPASLDAAAEPMAAAEPEPVGEPEATSEPEAATPASEPPRAIFAEFGFDGPADDQIGWMTTPSASLSEPESAPETWFDETATSEEAAPAEAEATEPTAAEFITPEPATDSWFDDVAGAAVIETTVVSNEEFWLPPDLTRVPAPTSPETETVSAHDESPSAEVEPEVTAPAAESAAEATMAAAELHNDYAEPETPAHTEAISEVEEPASLENDSPAPSYWSEPVAAAQDEPAEPAHAEQASPPSDSYWMNPVAAAPSESGTMEPERTEEHATSDWSEPAVAEEAVTPVAESSYPAPPALSYYSTPMPEREAESAEPELEMVEEPTAQYEAVGSQGVAPVAEYAASVEAPEGAATSDASDELNDSEEFSRSASIAEAMPPAEVVMGLTPASVAAVPPSAPAPFVTETLAELYLQQGFRDEALSIYRQLVERDPANQSLRDRVAQLERGDLAATAANVNEPPVENRASSQSVRTFFSRLARRTASTPTRSTESSDDASKANPDVPFAAAASALANLFSASKPPASDEGAASTLAGAFTDPAGRPSRAADRELSLDHLFRDVPPGGSAGGSVSLDEFYATPNAAQDSSTESGEASEPGAGEPGGTDIRQFTAWLEGLRKK